MHQRRIPEWLRHAPTPSVRSFAALAGTEAIARGMLVSVFPLELYRALGDASRVSEAYFIVGLLSLAAGLMVPYLGRFVPRRLIYSAGALVYVLGTLTAVQGSPAAMVLALMLATVATVTIFVCFNAYVLDFIARSDLGRCETSRMFYSALGWTAGPVLGVFLLDLWRPLPFLIAAGASASMLVLFLVMRLGNGRLIVRAAHPPASPLAFLGRFFRQPRLVAGWLFAVIRSCGWWIYVVYLPIFAVERGLGDQLGGIALSVSNGLLFLTPFMLRWIQRNTLRRAVRTGFAMAGALFVAAGLAAGLPLLAVAGLFAASVFLILLDVCAGLPFLLAVKPSERTEMSAVYASFRDVSGILTPGAAWLVLIVAPLPGIFVAGGMVLIGAFGLAGKLHPRLGITRVRPGPASETTGAPLPAGAM